MREAFLTAREMDLLRLSAYSNDQVAQRLGVSLSTVKNTWRILYIKLLGPRRHGYSKRGRRIVALTTAAARGIIALNDIEFDRERIWMRSEENDK
jgi:DNA-binding CsgD family transcriptional regulator